MNVSCKQQQETGPAAIGSSYCRWFVDDRFPCRSLSSQPYPKLTPERCSGTAKRQKSVLRGLIQAGGIIWLWRGSMPSTILQTNPPTNATHQTNNGIINLYKSMPAINILPTQTPLRLARQSQEVMAKCIKRRSQNLNQQNHQCSRSFSSGRAI